MGRSADREADALCKPTCPAVDGAFSDLWSDLESWVAPAGHKEAQSLIDACCELVKNKGTLLLRAALVEACEDKQRAEGECESLQAEIDRLTSQVSDLRDEVRELSKELEAA